MVWCGLRSKQRHKTRTEQSLLVIDLYQKCSSLKYNVFSSNLAVITILKDCANRRKSSVYVSPGSQDLPKLDCPLQTTKKYPGPVIRCVSFDQNPQIGVKSLRRNPARTKAAGLSESEKSYYTGNLTNKLSFVPTRNHA